MNSIESKCKPLTWLMAVLATALLAGCGGGSGGQDPILGAGGVGLAPMVSATTPANNATGVPLNGALTATFSQAMDPSTISAVSFTLAGPGTTPVSGTVTYVGTTASFAPANNLVGGVTYTATITTGAKNPSGYALVSNYVWTFTTGAAADTTAPTVTSTAPANNATSVAFNVAVNATFSEAMNPLTITTATYKLTGPGTASVIGTVTYAGTTATFTPASPLAASTLYTATMSGGASGAKDLAGNALVSNYVWTFTTGAAADTTAPTVTSTAPANNATSMAFNVAVNATFSEAMNPLTITTATYKLTGPGTTPVIGTVTYAGTTATFTPAAPLAASTLYTATMSGGASGAKDLAGNALASNYVWTFTTGAAADTTAPTVTSTAPANNATNVAFNVAVNATFSEAMNPLTITTATYKLTGPGTTPVIGTVTYAGTTATFTPAAPLAASTLYTATMSGGASGAKDLAGNALASNYVWTFTTGAVADTTAPTVTSTAPANNATNVAFNVAVNATFSESMEPLTITTATYKITGPGTTPVAGAVTIVGTTATFTPTVLLTASTLYTATMSGGTSGAKDLAGNALAGDYVWTFTTGAAADTTAPTVISTAPANNMSGVAINAAANATFSESMDPLTITTATYILTGPGTTPVTGAVTFVGTTATFTPTVPLAASMLYTATMSGGASGAKDLAGNALASNYVWTFTTGAAADTTAPTVISTVPVNNAPNVAVNAAANATFSEAMDPLTITTATYKLTGPGTTPVTGAVTFVGTTATFTPAAPLAASTLYTATMSGGTSGAKDLAGNALAGDYVWTFTTGVAVATGPAPVNLGTAGNFVLLAKSGISTTGTTAIVGDIGVSPAAETFITGFSQARDPSNVWSTAPIVTGKIYAANMAVPTPTNMTTAISDMEIAFTDAAGRATPDATELGAGNISGLTLVPGLYKWGTGVLITSAGVTLSGGPNDVWIFQIAQDLTVNSGAIVTLSGGAQAKNIFWQVSGQATLGTTVNFKGNILSQTLISLNTGAVLNGRALAQTAVTLNANAVTAP